MKILTKLLCMAAILSAFSSCKSKEERMEQAINETAEKMKNSPEMQNRIRYAREQQAANEYQNYQQRETYQQSETLRQMREMNANQREMLKYQRMKQNRESEKMVDDLLGY